MILRSLARKITTLENCINAQERDFPNISRSDAEKLGELLYLSLTGHDTEKNMDEYRALRAAQTRKCDQNSVKMRPKNKF